MTITPVHLLAFLLLSALITAVLTVARPHLARAAALVAMALFGFGWLLVRAALPLRGGIGPPGQAWSQWSWQVDSLSWSVSLAIVLVALAALALTDAGGGATQQRRGQPLLVQALASAALVTCWPANFATAVTAWAALNGIWLGAANLPARRADAARMPMAAQVGLACSGIFFLWLAGASAGGQAGGATDPEGWSQMTRSLALVAATFQMVVFPLFLWRAFGRAAAPLAALLHVAPSAAGAMLLLRVEAAVDIGLAFALPFTLTGLLAVALGAWRAWIAAGEEAALPVALIQAQSGLVVLAAVWAGAQAIVGEITVLLLAGGILLLATASPMAAASRLPAQPGVLIAVAALAALPLTAGFAGRSATYSAWLQQGRWLLILVSALLQLPLVAAAFNAMRSGSAPGARAAAEGHGPALAGITPLLALVLPALGLFSLPAWGEAPLAAWLAILLPAAAAAALAWRLEESAELRQTLREAMSAPLPRRAAWLDVRSHLAAFASAARHALTLLEGEGGLLWLLVFVVIIYLVR